MTAAVLSSPYSEPIAVPRPPRRPSAPSLVLLVVLVLVLALGQCKLAHAPTVSPDRPLVRRRNERDLQEWMPLDGAVSVMRAPRPTAQDRLRALVQRARLETFEANGSDL